MLKVFAFLTKLPELSEEAFSTHWRHPHGTLTKKISQIRCYAQNHGIGTVPGVPRADATGVATIWVDDTAALSAMAQHPDYPPLDADGDEMYVRSKLSWLVSDPVRSVAAPDAAGAKAMLFLKTANGNTLDRWALDQLAVEGALLPGVTAVNSALATDPAAAPYAAVLELSFPDTATFTAAWQVDGAAFVDRLGEVADLSTSAALLAREERVIWPMPVAV